MILNSKFDQIQGCLRTDDAADRFLKNFEAGGASARSLFIDFSSAFKHISHLDKRTGKDSVLELHKAVSAHLCLFTMTARHDISLLRKTCDPAEVRSPSGDTRTQFRHGHHKTDTLGFNVPALCHF